jgi:hypothetical protein
VVPHSFCQAIGFFSSVQSKVDLRERVSRTSG